MAVRRMHSIIAVLLILVITGFFVICHMETANAYVDPSSSEESAKAAQAADDSGTNKKSSSTDIAKANKKKSSSSSASGTSGSTDSNSTSGSSASGDNSDDDEDVVEENAFSTPGNASLGDVIRDSGSKDFYTIKTDNDNTYYLVIDHEGNMDNVYMLSTIDEEDLKDFLEDNSSGSLILPETEVQQEEAPASETQEPEPQQKSKVSGIVSLAIILLAAAGGGIAFMRYRRRNEEPEDDYSEDMEGEGIPTVNEDEEFLE